MKPPVGGDAGELRARAVPRGLVRREGRAQPLLGAPLGGGGGRRAIEEEGENGDHRGDQRDRPQEVKTVPNGHMYAGTLPLLGLIGVPVRLLEG